MKLLLAALVMVLAFGGAARADDWADCRHGDPDRRIRGCTNIITVGRDSRENLATAYATRGFVYGNRGDYDREIADETKAIDLKPDYADAYANRGNAYGYNADPDRTIADETEAIRLKPDFAIAYLDRGDAYRNKGDHDRAIADFDHALQLDPRLATRVTDLKKKLQAGSYWVAPTPAQAAAWADDWPACRKVEDPDPSIRACTKIIAAGLESREDLALAYVNRGAAYGNKSDYDREITDATEAIRLDPQFTIAYVKRGYAFNGKGEYDRAIADLDKAIELKPDEAEAYLSRGAAYGNKGDHDHAIADETEAIRIKPDLAMAYSVRGSAYEDKGDYDHAIADETKAIGIKPDAMAYVIRGDAYDNKGDHDRADADFAQAVRLEPQLAILVPTRTPAIPPAPVPRVAAASIGHRVALVIGNGAYQNVAQLTNPTNDAMLIADALRQDGFGVTVTDNLDHEGFIKALRTFASEADNADWAVVYFAGHGIEMGGTNYLIPVDAKLLTDRDVDLEAVPIGQVMSAIDGAHVLRVVILDACRNNPFAATMKRIAGAERSIGRGLARIEPEEGTVIVYSARPGQVAADGDGPHSPFAAALAGRLVEAGVEINKTFRLVRDDVFAATGSTQQVFQDSSLPATDFFFRPQ